MAPWTKPCLNNLPPDGPADTWTKPEGPAPASTHTFLFNLNSSELGFCRSILTVPHTTHALHSPCFARRSCSPTALGNLQEGRGAGDSPHARGLAQAARPGQLAALPGTVLPIRLPRALALLLVLLLVIVELLDAVLVADLQ